MKRVASLLLPLSMLWVGACAGAEDGADSPIEAWEQAWDDAEPDVRTNMCGTFRGEYPLHDGDNGPEALYDVLDEEGYVLSLDYDDWHEWMDRECT